LIRRHTEANEHARQSQLKNQQHPGERPDFSVIELGSGPLVLALHGFPGTTLTLHHQMKALAAAGHRVVAPYMRAYAPTDAPPNVSYEWAALTQDVLALMDVLSDQPVILIGHDWGAAAACAPPLCYRARENREVDHTGDALWRNLAERLTHQSRSTTPLLTHLVLPNALGRTGRWPTTTLP
jgi:hypothetical protein